MKNKPIPSFQASLPVMLFSLLLTSCFPVHSGLNIAVQHEFVLGEGGRKGFKADLRNTGPSEVEILGIDKSSGKLVQGIVLERGADASLSVGRGEKVILRNLGEGEASLKVTLSKNVQGMRYQAIPSER